MEIRTLKQVPLDFDEAFSYILQGITENFPSLEHLFEKFAFKEGSFYTRFPNNAYLDRLYDFNLSGIIPPEEVIEKKRLLSTGEIYIPKCIFTTKRELKHFIFDYLKNNKFHYCFLLSEDKNIHLNENSTLRDISNFFLKSNPYAFAIYLMYKNNQESQIDDLEKILNDIEYLIFSAYNGEAELFWERGARSI